MKEYRLGSRFFKYRNLCGVIVSVVVFTFYFIYDYVLSGSFQWWDSGKMVFVFILVGAVFLALIWKGADMVYRNVSYSISKDALVCSSWGHTAQYPFRSFRSARPGTVSFSAALPVVFELEDGRTLQLNQYIEELPELTLELLARIAPFAQIDSQLEETMNL